MSKLPPSISKHLRKSMQPAVRSAPGAQQVADAMRRAKQHRDNGELRQAERLCMRILSRDPDNAQALFMAGTLSLDVDDPLLAIQFFSRVVEKQPKSAEANVGLARTYEQMRDYEEAIKHFKRALAVKPDLVEAMRGLGRCYTSSGKANLALPLFEKALRHSPDHGPARFDNSRA